MTSDGKVIAGLLNPVGWWYIHRHRGGWRWNRLRGMTYTERGWTLTKRQALQRAKGGCV